MQIVIIDSTRWRGKGFYLPTLDVAFISDKVAEAERESLLDRLKQSQNKTIWR
ncbi:MULTISPECIES: hypothetical protein [unclassified Streptococcus]|uniref:hypothetical protein n=1 Tax=unclassified Streptococcus TaxID=2608887 RepID=UPI00359DC8C5